MTKMSITRSSQENLCPPKYDDNKNQFLELPKETHPRSTSALQKCQFIKLHYRKHLGLFKKIFGFGLLLFSLAKLVVNEKDAVVGAKAYEDGLRSVNLLSSTDEILEENEGKLIHVSGYLEVFKPLEEYPYGVSIPAVKLKRRVQMYQWVEERAVHTDDFDESLHYTRAWRDKAISSSNFALPDGHYNPEFRIESEVRVNSAVRLGSFTLSPELKGKFSDLVQFTSGERPQSAEIKMHMGLYYHASDLWNPTVGDLRIQFSFAGLTDTLISVIGKQVGNELQPFYTDSGKSILYLHEGEKTHLDILHAEHYSSNYSIWATRGATWCFTLLGTFLASKTIVFMNRRNAVVKNLMDLGPFHLSFLLTCFLWSSAVGCVWFTFKPIFGVLLVTFSSCLFLYYVLIPSSAIRDPTSEKTSLVSYYAKRRRFMQMQKKNPRIRS